MSDGAENQTQKEAESCIASVLPRSAALSLLRASQLAKELPEGSLARAQVIRDAEKKTKAEFPHFFRHEDSHGK